MFRSSSGLATAYGIAVTATMVVTTLMAFLVLWKCWKWSPQAAALLIGPFLLVDAVFFGANLLKIADGGWLPLLVAAWIVTVMLTWRRGMRVVSEKAHKADVQLDELVDMLDKRPPERVSGTAVFLTGTPGSTPTALLHNLKHNKVLHERNVILSVVTEDMPRVDESSRVTVEPISESFLRVTLRFGFMETPNVSKALPACRRQGWKFDVMDTSFFLSRRTLRPAALSPMPVWQDWLFLWLAHRADDASRYFSIPTGRVVEVGTQIAV